MNPLNPIKNFNAYDSYTGNGVLNKMEGIISRQHTVGVKILTSSVSYRREDDEDIRSSSGEIYIKKNLVLQLAEKILEGNLVEIQKSAPNHETNPFNKSVNYKARIIIGDIGMEHINVDLTRFEWKDKFWSEEDLIKALEIAYPERML